MWPLPRHLRSCKSDCEEIFWWDLSCSGNMISLRKQRYIGQLKVVVGNLQLCILNIHLFHQSDQHSFFDLFGLKCHETIRTHTQARVRETAITVVIPSGARNHSLPPAHISQKKAVIKSMKSGTSRCNKPIMIKDPASIIYANTLGKGGRSSSISPRSFSLLS